jgi:hypothetical protein
VALENQRHLTPEQSDAICALNTKFGYAERLYYNQGKEFQIPDLHCPVIINGVFAHIIDQADLLDRTVTFRCDYLGEDVRSEDAFRQRFHLIAPRLFGVVLDGLVGAMKARRDFHCDNDEAALALLDGWHTRFVDAAVWGEAFCRTVGFEYGEYAAALKANKDIAFREIAENNQICGGIRKLMDRRGGEEWRGYPTELCTAIRPYIRDPLDPSWFMRRDLPLMIPVLDKICGIEIETGLRLYYDDNRNGIIIRVPRGTHFQNTFSHSSEGESSTPSSGFTRRV